MVVSELNTKLKSKSRSGRAGIGRLGVWGWTAKQVVNAWLWTNSAAAGHLTRVRVCVSGWQAASAQAAQAPSHSLGARPGNWKGAPAAGAGVGGRGSCSPQPKPPIRQGRPPPGV
jgi:hypothetical protein